MPTLPLYLNRLCSCGMWLTSEAMTFLSTTHMDIAHEEGECGNVGYSFHCPHCHAEFESYGLVYDNGRYLEIGIYQDDEH